MKVLLCHEFYQQFGGEDRSYLSEAALLRAHGHRVIEYTRHHDDIDLGSRVGVATRSIWNAAVYRELRELIRRERPDIMHCTNIFPLISPSAYQAAHDEGVPVVQALRNYRLLCPSATLMRNGHECDSCVNLIFAWPAVQHGCYHGSRLGSAVVATMLAIHNFKGSWQQVDRFYTPSRFARNVFVQAGMPIDRIDVNPNFVLPDLGPGSGDGGYALFVGRLSPEKGISTLLSAWSELKENIPLRIVGDGPCRESVNQAAARDSRITPMGYLPVEQVYEQLRGAKGLVMPSIWYETFGRTIIEAYAAGTPVVASRMGAMEELVVDRETGLLFEPGSASALSQTVKELWSRQDLVAMRQRARREFEDKYTADEGYVHLMSIYKHTIGSKCFDQCAQTPAAQTVLASPRYALEPTSFLN
jgi:glycosyltransferase involved in cell wall biosynthesis